MPSAAVSNDLLQTEPRVTRAGRLTLRRAAIAGAALALLAGAGWYAQTWWTTGRFIETTDDAYVGGNITAIAPHVSGFIAEVLVTDNQRVHAGQTLLQLDRRDQQAALDHATAAVDARLATSAALRAQLVLQQAVIRQQEAELAAKAAQLSYAVQDADRYRSLATTSAGTRQDAQRTTSLEQQARSAVAAAAAALEASHQQVRVLEADIAAADANVAQARSDVRIAELNLGYTDIVSPIDGYIANRAAQVGAYVTAGAYLVSVVPTRGLWVDANFKEDQLTHLVAGDRADIAVDLLPGHVFHGRVASLAHGTGAVFSVLPAENATGNFTKIVQRVPVRVLLDANDPELAALRPGLSTLTSVDIRTPDIRASGATP